MFPCLLCGYPLERQVSGRIQGTPVVLDCFGVGHVLPEFVI